MKLIVVSICHNEAQTIGQVLDGVPKNIPGISSIEKIVVDDGSTDDTVKVARQHGAKVVQNINRKRVAYAFATAVDYVLSNEADIAVNIDGDMQFDPKEIPLLVTPIVEGKADFVAADRFTDPKTGKKRKANGMPLGKYFGNILGASVISKLTGQKFTDVTCGFRAYNRKALLSVNINSKNTYTQETFQVLASRRLNMLNIPTSVKYFKGRKSRVIDRGILSYIFKSAGTILVAFRDFSPMTFFGYLGFSLFLPGLIAMSFVGIHFLNTGDFSPYKFVGLTGLYVASIGILSWIVGLLADMLNRVVNNQEKILYFTKAIHYSKKERK